MVKVQGQNPPKPQRDRGLHAHTRAHGAGQQGLRYCTECGRFKDGQREFPKCSPMDPEPQLCLACQGLPVQPPPKKRGRPRNRPVPDYHEVEEEEEEDEDKEGEEQQQGGGHTQHAVPGRGGPPPQPPPPAGAGAAAGRQPPQPPLPPPPQEHRDSMQEMAKKYQALLIAASWIHTPAVRLAGRDGFLLGGHTSAMEALFVRCICRDCLAKSTSGAVFSMEEFFIHCGLGFPGSLEPALTIQPGAQPVRA